MSQRDLSPAERLERITACGLCMEICPTRNIAKDQHGHPLWGRDCLLCLSCEMKCPEDAVASFISRPVFRTLIRPFLRYNVTRWVTEPDLEHVRVIHRHGETERLDTGPRSSARG